jgi:small ligand-binding sensory domain FIST
VSVRIGAGLSTELDPLAAATEAARVTARALHGAEADLVLVFAAGAHLAAPEAMLEGVHAELSPSVLIGCGAGGVLASGRELESGTALAVWAASFDGTGEVRPFHARLDEQAPEPVLEGMPSPGSSGSVIMLSDPYSFPTDAMLSALADQAPGVPVLGGLSSARTPEGTAALFVDDRLCQQGAVGVCLDGIEILPCVSQGAAPLGPEVTITAAQDNIVYELAGRPAIETIETIIGELPAHQQALVAAGLLIGIVIGGGKPDYEQGDFLVRGVLGADSSSGAIAVGADVSEGQVVRLHARDARCADQDLRRELRVRAQALAGSYPAGALLFSCSGRGQAMFGACDHDATLVEQELDGAPTAGFFAAGEIGPVGGRSFLHGFTATVAVFPG